MKKKIAFIIPGYPYSPRRKEYQTIASYFSKAGMEPVLINITWKTPTPRNFNDYLKEIARQTRAYKNCTIYLLGFSFGAILALLAAKKLKPKAIILCSLSPYFTDDIEALPTRWASWWKKHYKDKLDFLKLTNGLNSKAFLLVGAKEHVSVRARAKTAHKQLRHSSLHTVPRVEHKLQDPLYLKAVQRIIRSI